MKHLIQLIFLGPCPGQRSITDYRFSKQMHWIFQAIGFSKHWIFQANALEKYGDWLNYESTSPDQFIIISSYYDQFSKQITFWTTFDESERIIEPCFARLLFARLIFLSLNSCGEKTLWRKNLRSFGRKTNFPKSFELFLEVIFTTWKILQRKKTFNPLDIPLDPVDIPLISRWYPVGYPVGYPVMEKNGEKNEIINYHINFHINFRRSNFSK